MLNRGAPTGILLLFVLMLAVEEVRASCATPVCYPGSTCLCAASGCERDQQELRIPCGACGARGESYTGAVVGTCSLEHGDGDGAADEFRVVWAAGGCAHPLKAPDEHWRDALGRAGLDTEFGFEWDIE